MPSVSTNKNHSILRKQILGELGGSTSSGASAGGSTVGQQGTPSVLIARYRLTAPQTAPVSPKAWTNLSINTNDAQSPSAAVTSQTPFIYTAPEFAFVRVEVRVNVTHTANLGRWVLAFRITRNGFTSDAAFTLHKAKSSSTVWQLALNERIWIETDDVLKVDVRVFNEGAAAETLTVLDADISLHRG